MKKQLFLFLLVIGAALSAVDISFAEGQWKPEDWLLVKDPRWPNIGSWVQEKDSIRNAVPDGCTPKELQGKRAAETFTSMLWKQPVAKSATITATMSFEYLMAPEIMLSTEPVKDRNGYPEYAERWEIVLYNQGINVWHHEIKDGKPYWRKAAFVLANFEPNKKYTMTVQVSLTPKVPQLTITCEGITFGCMLPTLPKPYYVGITACEGVNRFYNFSIK